MLASNVMQNLQRMLPEIAAEAKARSLEFEARRSISPDFASKLKEARLFNILVPEASGGCGGSLPEWLEVMTCLAEADASTAWVSAHSNLCSALIYACAEPRFRDDFFANPNACAAWSNLPQVEAVESTEGL